MMEVSGYLDTALEPSLRNIFDAATEIKTVTITPEGVWGKWYRCDAIGTRNTITCTPGGSVTNSQTFTPVTPIRQYSATLWERIATKLGYTRPIMPWEGQ